MAGEIKVARETKVMGLSSRNAVSGRTDRSLGRAAYPSMNPRTAGNTGQWTRQGINERFRNTNGRKSTTSSTGRWTSQGIANRFRKT